MLLYLIYSKSKKLLAQYRYLMATFSIYAIVYNYVDIAVEPLVLVEQQMYVVVNHGPWRYHPLLGFVMTCCFGASFGMCISLLSTQFFYRYLALCQPNVLSYFEGIRLALIYIPSAIISITWFSFCFFGLSMNQAKEKILHNVLLEYGEDSSKISYVGGLYWNWKEDGGKDWNTEDIIGSAGLTFLMSICCVAILFCGIKTYKKMNDVSGTMSNRTKELNKQLFVTLTLQTLLPFILMYAPVGLLFMLPLFETNIGFLAASSAASTAVYPALEPLIAIFCITPFRKAFMCQSNRKVSSNLTSSAANS